MKNEPTRLMRMLQNRFGIGAFVCVGLDTDYERIPEHCRFRPDDPGSTMVTYNMNIIDATSRYAAAYKPNLAFYASYGERGFTTLGRTIAEIRKRAPGVPIVLDAKWGDIGNTNNGYARYAFDILDVDAVTLNPLMGMESLEPFFARIDRTCFILCKTSNPGSEDFLGAWSHRKGHGGNPLYINIAHAVSGSNKNSNLGLVVGATYPVELEYVRAACPDIPILIPGVGAQGGDLEACIRNGAAPAEVGGYRFLINSSRGILFASSGEDCFERAGEEAKKLNDAIQQGVAHLW